MLRAYLDRSSIHGLQYVGTEAGGGVFSRLLWLLSVAV